MQVLEYGGSSGMSLPQKLARLHTTPIPFPVPKGFSTPVFGFPVATYIGCNPQNNSWSHSWPEFFAENRLVAAYKLVEEEHGNEPRLQSLLKQVISKVVPRLLGDGHLGGKKGIQPVLVHGDLLSGNRTRGRLAEKGGIEEVIFNPSCCYAHSEYEIGIMMTFGGFPSGFFNEYHQLIPKTEPTKEYHDRLELYQL